MLSSFQLHHFYHSTHFELYIVAKRVQLFWELGCIIAPLPGMAEYL
uniref:Uncharacterized protein n=1 Tax=Anguilla anguilla TaxID=7936 RepID=A0A0E9T2K6_ANGAN